MPESSTDSGYLSIGEVLGLLLEEFPDVTISKIRFLESQGLIHPERTASGYRKFYDDDVQLLRVILDEQRQNYLPLRVIKDRLENGEIDPTGEQQRPVQDRPAQDRPVQDRPASSPAGHAGDDEDATGAIEAAEVPSASIAKHPAARHRPEPAPAHAAAPPATPTDPPATSPRGEPPTTVDDTGINTADTADHGIDHDDDSDAEPVPAQLLPGVLLDRSEFCAMVQMTERELSELESFGIITPRDTTGSPTYDDNAVAIARPACQFLRSGVDARHLRGFRTAAEREASLYEQLVTPRFRQRNPQSRAEGLAHLRELDQLGGQLRAALTKQALSRQFDL